jgi:hypothetical protein
VLFAVIVFADECIFDNSYSHNFGSASLAWLLNTAETVVPGLKTCVCVYIAREIGGLRLLGTQYNVSVSYAIDIDATSLRER